MILLSHPTGNQNVRAVLRGIDSDRLLGGFATTLAVDPSSFWFGLLPRGARNELLRRAYAGIPSKAIHSWPWRELVRLGACRLGLNRITRHEIGWASVDAIYRDFDSRVATRLPLLMRTQELRGAYAYEDGALETFKVAHKLGLRCFYDQPIGHWKAAQRILAEEAELQPDWAATLTGNRDSAQKRARKDKELALADDVFVASSFTRSTLLEANCAAKKIHVIPYGAPQVTIEHGKRTYNNDNPLRVLFVGSLGQRKGLSYLLQAIDMLGSSAVELTLVGQPLSGNCDPLRAALTTHRHLFSLPHASVLAEMRQHDVFVFPSLFEGFGLVLLEAMSQGLPVITTTHTGGPDFMTDGQDGFLVPIRSAAAIAEKLELLHRDRNRLAQMAEAALSTARRRSWMDYEKTTATILRNCLNA